jgi:hypothetical protein
MKHPRFIASIRTVSWKWWAVVILLKATLFLWYAEQFRLYYQPDMVVAGWAIETNDTYGYYEPLQDAAEGRGYSTACRMPALLPVYVPAAYWFSPEVAKLTIVFIQWAMSVVSCILLALMATSWFRTERIFGVVAVVYAGSSFVSIWDHYLMSDSLSVSLFILSCYLLMHYLYEGKNSRLILSALFLVWSLFFRQIMIIVLPVYAGILLLDRSQPLLSRWRSAAIFCIPFVVFIGVWGSWNHQRSGKWTWLVTPLHQCYETYSLPSIGMSEMIIDMGQDYLSWSEGSLSQWMFAGDYRGERIPYLEQVQTTQLTADSLILLRNEFAQYRTLSKGDPLKEELEQSLLEKQNRFVLYYKTEHSFDYYIINHFRHLRRFLWSNRLDNLPGPAASEMNIVQFALKAGFYILLLTLSTLGTAGLILVLFAPRHRLFAWAFFAGAFLFTLGFWFGYSEQRYLAPVYPFLIIFSLYSLSHWRRVKAWMYPHQTHSTHGY